MTAPTDHDLPTLPDETHPPRAADREGAAALRSEEDEVDDEDVMVIAAEQALLDDRAADDEEPLIDEPEPPVELWEPVADGGDEDLVLHEDEPPAPEIVWGEIIDQGEPELTLTDVQERPDDDPWGPVDRLPAVREEPRSAPPAPPRPLPPAAQRPTPIVPRVIPWRSVVTPAAPDLGRVLLTADPTRAASALCVSSWSPLGPTSLQVRLAGDSEAIVLTTAGEPPGLQAAVVVAGFPLEVQLTIETAEEVVGIVLGRDALAGRFVVDAALEATDVRAPRD